MEKKKQTPAKQWLTAALVAAAALSLWRMGDVAESAAIELSTPEFRAAVRDGAIVQPLKRIINHDEGTTRIEGEMLVKEQTPPKDDAAREGGPGAVPAGTPGGKIARKAFRVNLAPGENERLMNELADANVKVLVRTERTALSPLVVNLLFFMGFLFVFYWFTGRRMGGGGLFGMGKSPAKMLTGKEETRKATFGDVAGVDEAKEEVQEIVEFLKKPDDFRKLGGRIPKGVLLVGPPGTGKTLLARAIAGEAGVPFFAISGSDFEEMFVGVGASRMRDMFAEAKKRAPCIVFIDEIDSIGMKRGTAGSLTGSHAYEQTLNTMLVEMDGFDANEGVIVIAATNRPDTLDPALLRPGRFDRQVVIDLPTLKGREEILALHGKKIKFAAGADLKRVARGTPGFSGADLANLLNEAALMAAKKKLDGVDMATLDEARDKILWGRERRSAGYSPKEREKTAWHEAGHALLQLSLEHTDPLHKVTVIPRGRALGATMALPEKDVLGRTKAYFLDEICVCCGGRIAEELFTGDISTGAAQDIAQATEMARSMVCKFGMGEPFGFQAFDDNGEYGPFARAAFSEQTAREIDEEVSRIISGQYAKAKEIISQNREGLEKLAAALVEKETMDGREVEELLGISKERAGEEEEGADNGGKEGAAEGAEAGE